MHYIHLTLQQNKNRKDRIMEKNIILAANKEENKPSELTELVKGFAEWISTPTRLLAKYYSSVLGRSVSTHQTWLLIEAQAAFFAGVIPADIPVIVRILMVAWFASAAIKCKNALKKE